MYLHVEGIDLSGKSSAIHEFTNNSQEDWNIQPGRLGTDSTLYNVATGAVGDYPLDMVGSLYAVAVKADLEAYNAPTKPTIQDSLFTVRSLAFFTAVDNRQLVRTFEDLLAQQPTFDHSFTFTASPEVRQERFHRRMTEEPHNLTRIDKMFIDNPELAIAVNDSIIDITREAFDATLIDTTNLSVSAASSIMREVIENNNR